MRIRVEGYEMSEEEKVSRIVELTTENSIINLKTIALTSLLMEKELITEEEVNQSYENIINVIEEQGGTNGIITKDYIAFARDYLGLE